MSTRLPLAVGTSSLWSVARAAIGLVPGAVLVSAAIISIGAGARPLAIVGGIVGAYLLVFGAQHLRLAWRARASDVRLDGEGLEIEGGPHHRLGLRWPELDPAKTRVETVETPRLTLAKLAGDALFLLGSGLFESKLELAPPEKIPLRRLVLATHEGRELTVAEAEAPGEQRSLDALFETVQARLGQAAASPAPTAPTSVLGCEACGAPAVPDDVDALRCSFCGAAVEVPAELRERVRAHRSVGASERAIAAAVAALLDQPGAARTNTVLALAAAAAALVWLPIVASLLIAGATEVGAFELGWALVSGAALILVIFVFGRAALSRRRALRLLATSFGARPPTQPGGAPACRRCAAPLPASDAMIVVCIYCKSDNILGLDVHAHVAKTTEHELSLAEVIEARAHEQRRWQHSALLVLPLALVAGVMAITSYVVGAEFRADKTACEAGDAEACHEVAIDLRLGISVAEDEAKAHAYALQACDLDHGQACWDVAQDLYWGWGIDEDPDAAEGFRARACALEIDEACAGF